ncbi:SDR family NAD(P)-dependent oxidoreductase [Actinokineospora pegani]|uniref:SDR family NAD(P)-dependent oxidoreductase n=1 Tax=Actinokineospora pegani TaxID=2654637 RepID=UPI0012EAFFAD|nr:SDR family oxidoreductase [Actinokineospora pegani]
MNRFAGKKAVVSGGTHGMGLAVAKALIEGGAEVLVTGRDEDRIAKAKAELGERGHVVRADVTSIEAIKALGAEVGDKLGEIDLLHVNAGYAKLEPFLAVTEETYDRTFGVNTKGAFFTAQVLAPQVRDGGAIVFTTSIANTGGSAGMSVYGGAKAAVSQFSRIMAAELVGRNVRVNCVSPGFIDTPSMGVDASEDERREFSAVGDEITPMKRHGSAAEVAAAVLHLAFDATFTTGQELVVDGGLSVIS